MSKRKGCWRIGYLAGTSFSNYRKAESAASQWLMLRGLPKLICRSAVLIVRMLIVAALIYLSYWLAWGVFIFLGIKGVLEGRSHVEIQEPDFDQKSNLFPDPYSNKNINNPAYHDE
ncbi:DUF3742 family protein [Pseudomonas sp. 21LCFQ010]|uniref:DUF3742 family protein n=1 Tax=Pseudomonas sp. 21LCFQ010 TaxID=2957506 RepID=UPI002098296F|nr:DUF3742 family protein [Pseudomonas sp. 21LCFQ010]MCO8163905.1 DUF3742 family protein [Pseudomonas sp. 21LCFQ010]